MEKIQCNCCFKCKCSGMEKKKKIHFALVSCNNFSKCVEKYTFSISYNIHRVRVRITHVRNKWFDSSPQLPVQLVGFIVLTFIILAEYIWPAHKHHAGINCNPTSSGKMKIMDQATLVSKFFLLFFITHFILIVECLFPGFVARPVKKKWYGRLAPIEC